MISALTIVTVLSALVSVTARTVSRRMSPATTAVALTVASVTIAGTSTGILAVAAWYGVARFGPVAAAGGWSPRLLSNATPLPLPASAIAGIATLGVAVSVVRLWLRRAAELRSAQRLWYRTGRDPIVIADDDEIDAFAIEGSTATRRVILTAGLLRALPEAALQRAVIAHEQAHLRHHHLFYRLATETAARANPFLRPIISVVTDALESWADDEAARATGPATVATAIATVALTRAEQPPLPIALAIAESVTVRRIERLLDPARINNAGVVAGALFAVIALIVLGVSCHQTERFFEALRTASNI